MIGINKKKQKHQSRGGNRLRKENKEKEKKKKVTSCIHTQGNQVQEGISSDPHHFKGETNISNKRFLDTRMQICKCRRNPEWLCIKILMVVHHLLSSCNILIPAIINSLASSSCHSHTSLVKRMWPLGMHESMHPTHLTHC